MSTPQNFSLLRIRNAKMKLALLPRSRARTLLHSQALLSREESSSKQDLQPSRSRSRRKRRKTRGSRHKRRHL